MYGNANGEELSLWDDIACTNELPYICQVKVVLCHCVVQKAIMFHK